MSALSFYRPEFLWGLLFLGAALLIHLLRRPRARPLDFSTLRFFQQQAVKATRMRRLRKLLLLLTRLAAAALLVVLFAQPFNKHDRLSLLRDPGLTVFTWVDRTPSMQYTEGNSSLLSRANALADSLRSRLPPTVRQFQYDETQGGFFPYDPQRPPPVRTRHGPPRLDRVLRAWNESRAGCSLPLLVLMSDYQEATTKSLDTLLGSISPQAAGTIMCVPLPPHSPWNYSVRDAQVKDAGIVSVTAAAQGKQLDSADITITVSSIRTGQKRISIPENDTADITLAAGIEAPGGSAALTEKDPLPFDNTFFFIARNRRAVRAIIAGDREKNFPLAAALRASGENRWNPVIAKESSDITFDDLDSSGALILNSVNRASRTLGTFFADRSSHGKIVLLAFETDEEGLGINEGFISKVNRSPKPLRLVTLSTPAAIVLPDTISETWRGFPSLRTDEAAIYRYVEGLPGTVLLRLDNGTPIVTYVASDQECSWILIGTPLGVTDANNLCETGFYVPFIDRLLRYAAAENRVPPDAWIAGFERRNPMHGSGKGANVFDEEGKLVERWQSQPEVVFKQPGLYKIAPDNEEPYWIAVNADPEDSKLRYSLPEVPPAVKNSVLIVNERQLDNALTGHRSLLSYLPWLFLAVLLFVEVLLWENHRPPRFSSSDQISR
ncbi:MAG: BatA domain-containing protein [Chitinispirillaceae bacterium]